MLAPQVPCWVFVITLLAISNPTHTSRAVISARVVAVVIKSRIITTADILIPLILIPFGNMSITKKSIESMTYWDCFFLLDFLGDLLTSEYSLLHDSDVFFRGFFLEILFISSAVNPDHQNFSILFF